MARHKVGQVLTSEYKGPHIAFTEAHVVKAILAIGESMRLGRSRLGETLRVGQGEVRTLIRRLKETGLINIDLNGCHLTENGRKEFEFFSTVIPWRDLVNGSSLGIGKCCYGLIVASRQSRINKGIEQRDAAIRAGADAALTVFYSKNRFLIPFSRSDCEEKGSSEPWTSIRRLGKPKNGDVIILVGAQDALVAEYGALTAALTVV